MPPRVATAVAPLRVEMDMLDCGTRSTDDLNFTFEDR